ncbi:MAG: outer membrane protein assembly factor BamD [Acidobacteria bacterium]|nr:outer membrane protein assembly factor BamD [Acidobacteriota bacterium]
MKKTVIICGLVLLTLVWGQASVRAQGASRGPDASTVRDAELERDSAHNLEVARLYFKVRKAYVSSLSRCEEVIAGNPTFSRIDEVLYIAGMSSLFLSEKRGKQAPKEPQEKYREDARGYLSQLVTQFPESSFKSDAEKALQSMGAETKKPEEKKQ